MNSEISVMIQAGRLFPCLDSFGICCEQFKILFCILILALNPTPLGKRHEACRWDPRLQTQGANVCYSRRWK